MKTTNRQTSSITPEMIDHYRQLLSLRRDDTDRLCDSGDFGNEVLAFIHSHPFIIRFQEAPRRSQLAPVAYLSVVGGAVQWRYSPIDPGYERCPVVTHARAISELDDLFMRYYRQNQLPDALEDDRHHLSGRLMVFNECFFAGPERGNPIVSPEDPFIGKLICNEGAWEFVSQLADTLGIDRYRFDMKWVKSKRYPRRILVLRFGWPTRFVDVGMPGNLYLHLLLCLNELFWPHYQIRRYRNGNTGQGGILPILSVHDWDRLETLYGREAVDSKFERITPQTRVDIATDEWGDLIREYDEADGL